MTPKSDETSNSGNQSVPGDTTEDIAELLSGLGFTEDAFTMADTVPVRNARTVNPDVIKTLHGVLVVIKATDKPVVYKPVSITNGEHNTTRTAAQKWTDANAKGYELVYSVHPESVNAFSPVKEKKDHKLIMSVGLRKLETNTAADL